MKPTKEVHQIHRADRSASSQVLITCKEASEFVLLLKEKLTSYGNIVHVSSSLPASLQPFYGGFFIDVSERFFLEMISQYDKKLIFLFFDNHGLASRCHAHVANNQRGTIKIIHLQTSPEYFHEDIEKIFWFAFARSTETYLPIHHRHRAVKTLNQTQTRRRMKLNLPWQKILRPRYTVSFILSCVVVLHILFVPALAIASYHNYQAVQHLRTNNFDASLESAAQGREFLAVSETLYSIVRPTFSLFSLGMYPDNALVLNQSMNEAVTTAVSMGRQAAEFSELFLIRSKSPDEVTYMFALKEAIVEKLRRIDQQLIVINSKIPSWAPQAAETKNTISRVSNAMTMLEQMTPHLDTMLAREGQQEYLLLFANNMELRPGGGFIGSFATVTVANYTIEEIKVYDVYDADGQLIAHVRPPAPIRDYLSQPHWFLRDSAFSPDFAENVDQAEYFLEKSLSYESFDGVVLITTTAVLNLLEALGEVDVPDFDETITRDNFYLKAQLYAEQNFFPGSRNKQSFLSSVLNEILVTLPTADPLKLQEMLEKSLNEKQIVATFDDPDLQQTLDRMYWSGRTIAPNCTSSNENCIVDYIFPYDANLGVNKANFYISRAQEITAKVQENGTVNTTYSVIYRNESHDDVFPGGRYKNYFQILLPRSARIAAVQIDGEPVKDYDISRGEYTKVGFLMTVPPRSTTTISLSYQIIEPITTGSSIYQMIVQKQVGSANSDLKLSIELPESVYVTNQNFSPVVKGNTIVYNTTLAADKIFFVEFFQE